ncbi:hypothetical protein [Cerasicoccus arenae]|uniref:Uncharacterized protein n=1 Tax=Cerasicoccus arenae TaxID=424488 RepID=A0A8J3GEV3_9BACT|nr:hypothetical protein [Cerasicoccus arenae]MBK1858049.1 hypothetical protein [Cerasicoccus arenae]GHC06739.1 hypothetical protein GCM10007047_24720 [Cerasicoccus arenae]
MEDNVPLPRINKIPFIVADVLLVATAATIWFRTPPPLSPISIFWIFAAIFTGAFIACLPFFVEFRTMAKLKEYDLSQGNMENARRIESAMLGIQEVGETIIQHVDRNTEIVGTFETLLDRMESRIGKGQAGAGAAGIDPDQLRAALREQLDAVREEFAQSITEQVGMTTDAQHNKLNAALSKLQGLPMQVSLLGELAGRYQSIIAMMSDTAAQLLTSTPVDQKSTVAAEDEPTITEDSLDGVLEAEVEENVAAEAVTYGEIRILSDDVELTDQEDDDDYSEYEESEADDGAEPEFLPPEALNLPNVDLEGYDQLDARFDAEMEAEKAATEPEAGDDQEEEIETLALEEEPEDIAEEVVIDDEQEATEESDDSEAIDELVDLDSLEDLDGLEDEDDFDIALSSDADEEEAPAEEIEVAEEESAEEAVAVVDDEAVDEGGMGFDDWDDFGDIEPAVDDEAEGVEEAEPAQPELIGDLPETSPKSKSKKQKGVTTLIAQVLIGIGNKPYVRGVGPGLSETEGVPMEFLEIGKWQWVAPNSDEPVYVQIYKNDEVAAEGDVIEIPAGQRRSSAPKFPK